MAGSIPRTVPAAGGGAIKLNTLKTFGSGGFCRCVVNLMTIHSIIVINTTINPIITNITINTIGLKPKWFTNCLKHKDIKRKGNEGGDVSK